MLKGFAKFFTALNSNTHPGELAHACAIGVILGLVPKNNLLWWAVFIVSMFIRINRGCLLVTAFVVSMFAYLLDPALDGIGWTVLHLPPAVPVLTLCEGIPILGYTAYNNTLVAGGLALGMAVYVPVYVLFRLLVRVWRRKIAGKLVRLRIVQAVSKMNLVQKVADKIDF